MNIDSLKGLTVSELKALIKNSPNPAQDKELIKLVCNYLKEHKQDYNPIDAIRWITVMMDDSDNAPIEEIKIELVKKYKVIRNVSLITYIKYQGIKLNLAKKYLFELKVLDPMEQKYFIGLGFPHDKDGFAFSSPLLKDWINEPSLSFIKGKNVDCDTVHIFRNFWDFLSLLSHWHAEYLQTDVIVLNSYSRIPQVKSYLYQSDYKKVYTWLSNDQDGIEATRKLSLLFQQQGNLIHIKNNALYHQFHSLNEWFAEKLK